MIDRAKEKVDDYTNEGRTKTYSSREAADSEPSDATDPETFEDTTQKGWLERLRPYKIHLAILLIGGLFFTFYFSRTMIQLAPGLINNIWFQRLTVLSIVGGGSYYLGRRHQLDVMQSIDTLVVHGKQGIFVYFGEWTGMDDSPYDKFVPYKGLTRLGNLGEPYRVKDLDAELAQKAGREDMSADDVAAIRIGRLGRRTRTDFGDYVAHLGKDTKADPTGTETQIEIVWPDLADENSLEDLTQELIVTEEQKEYYRERFETVRSERDEVLDELEKREEEEVDKFIERARRLGDAFSRHTTSEQSDNQSEPDSEPDYDDFE